MLVVEQQDAGAHALQNQAVEGLQVGHVGGALGGQAFAQLQAAGQALQHDGGGEAQGAEGAGLQVLVGGGRAADALVEGQIDHADGRHGSDQQADAAAQQDVGNRHCHDQQVAQAARAAAGGVEQCREQQHIEQGDGKHLQQVSGVAHPGGKQQVAAQIGPADIAKQRAVGEVEYLLIDVAGDQHHQSYADDQAVQVRQAQDAQALVAA